MNALQSVNQNFRQSVLILILMLIMPISYGLPERPKPLMLVNDLVNLLSPSQVAALEQKLSTFARQHETGIVIVITNDLYGMEIADFSAQLGEEWGVGQAGMESGVVITVVPSGEKREVFITTGYGMEGVLPDAVAKRIVQNEIIPHFRTGDYYGGLDAATDVIMQLAAGEFPASEYGAQEQAPPGAVLIPLLMVLLMVFLLSRGRRQYASPGKSIPFLTLFWLLSHGNRGSRGSFGNFSSGTGPFGHSGGFGGSGGGFSGFGGGRFGGGGAGGSW
ncbi:MAG: TPM domain-containing protein [Bacteroidota bacterium]